MNEVMEGVTFPQYCIYTGLIIFVLYYIVPKFIDFLGSLHDRMVYDYAC